jgi:hypothetical protein
MQLISIQLEMHNSSTITTLIPLLRQIKGYRVLFKDLGIHHANNLTIMITQQCSHSIQLTSYRFLILLHLVLQVQL